MSNHEQGYTINRITPPVKNKIANSVLCFFEDHANLN